MESHFLSLRLSYSHVLLVEGFRNSVHKWQMSAIWRIL
jgi:hypothetical protein